MSQNLYHDAENNVLHVSANPVVTEKQLRGFIVTIANNQQDVEAIQGGDGSKMQLAPVMAPDEQAAIDVVTKDNKIPLSIISYEFLKFQTELLENLSKQENITLLNEQVYKAEQL